MYTPFFWIYSSLQVKRLTSEFFLIGLKHCGAFLPEKSMQNKTRQKNPPKPHN